MKIVRYIARYYSIQIIKLCALFLKFLWFWLGLLTFFLVTTVIPVTAQHFPPTPVVQQITNASQLLERGRNLYDSGRIAEAANVWEQAVKGFEAQGYRLSQALSLSYLSLAYKELGKWEQAQQAITNSLNLLEGYQTNQQSSSQTESFIKNPQLILAQVLNTQGNLQLARGQGEAALNSWQKAEKVYAQAEDEKGILGSQINQAQALQTLGMHRRSRKILEQVNHTLQTQSDSALKVTGLRSLGMTLQIIGDLDKSKEILEQSLAIAQQLNLAKEISPTLFSLGNTTRANRDPQIALQYYQQATATATNSLEKVEAQLNQLSLLIANKQWQNAKTLLPQIQSLLDNLSPSRAAIYAQVNLAESLLKLSAQELSEENPKLHSSTSHEQISNDIAQRLATTIRQAKNLQDQRAQSYALGTLGKLYEQQKQWSEAQKVTREALQLSQDINASDITYQWQWQQGRLFKAQGNITEAIASETEAVRIIQSLRSDLVAINPNVQFSFRESVEPIYRELVGLLLQTPSTSLGEGTKEISQTNLKQAREVIESLQLAELENFFREACLNAQPRQIDEIDNQAAVIYPIILPDRLAVILSVAGQPLRHYETILPQKEIENVLERLFQSLNPAFSNKIRLSLSQQVYDWLIRPAEEELGKKDIDTLVFVLDGFFRNLPMAALYNGQQYLIERYSIALTPGLQLLESQSLVQGKLKAVMAGLSEAKRGFSSLPGVELELNNIASQVPTEQLLNQNFTSFNLQQQIRDTSFPVIHLATHGQFSSDPEETFILTWDDKINIKELESLISSRERLQSAPIELLVLSACQTAAGDQRATLGLAGIAVRSGARSTLATLWSVKDDSTALLMSKFYQELIQSETKGNKAKSLRQAQLALLKTPGYEHPFYWSPFVLVGNWQ